jgi:hypothetical protein
MKKIIAFICFISLSSCNSDTVTIPKDEYNRLKGIKAKEYPKYYVIYGSNHDWQIVLGADGHEYLENDSFEAYVLTHYPGCKKCFKFN